MYKFLKNKQTVITIKRYTFSIDDEMYFDIWLMIHSVDFREFPIIPDLIGMSLGRTLYIIGLNFGLDDIRKE